MTMSIKPEIDSFYCPSHQNVHLIWFTIKTELVRQQIKMAKTNAALFTTIYILIQRCPVIASSRVSEEL